MLFIARIKRKLYHFEEEAKEKGKNIRDNDAGRKNGRKKWRINTGENEAGRRWRRDMIRKSDGREKGRDSLGPLEL